MAEPEVQREEELPPEDAQAPQEDASPVELEKKEPNIESETKEFFDKMPDKNREEFLRDFGIMMFNITYQGNYVENSGTIYGGITQQQECCDTDSSNSENAIRDFFCRNKDVVALAALLTLATFESVQESLFFDMALSLVEKLRFVMQPSETENLSTQTYLKTVDELLSPFSIQREMRSLKYGDVALDLRCLAFEDKHIPYQVRKWTWEMYPQLRFVLTDWLLQFQSNTDSATDRALAYASTQRLALYASLDVEYACHKLIPLLEHNCTNQAAVKYIVTFIQQFMQAENCQMVSDELLHRWCNEPGRLFWQIPYQLYNEEEDWHFCKDVSEALRKRLLQDYNGLNRPNLEWYGQNRGYFLYPAHRNKLSASLLAQEISRCFANCKIHQDRLQMAVYFLVLFRWDYLTDFSSSPELSFLRSFHNKKTRNALLPIFQFIWRNVELRNNMRQVLECHFAEINTNIALATYLEKPFEFLAFTGNRIDFQNTNKLLQDCAKQKNAQPTAEHLIRHLNRILEQRQAIKLTGKV